ncbi:meiosis-specific protein MEI4 isoform X2 [Scyliorhinus canicula]|uniref:meiosis-specific protein MEI4 isoform X2 n=1 Tax=Scyliorhinus canicula TaxID=7830 RepID=UPI0018F49146|nr:meiosis-specific protein MEI4 isoform X2 [Scyliorhinus canicula]
MAAGGGPEETATSRSLPLNGQQLNEDVLTWYLKTSKLALALAVIGSTPPGKSSREHAEHLAKTLGQREVEWKLKAETWKAEVLHLRQELFLSRIKSVSRSNNGADSAFCIDNPPQDSLEFRSESVHLEDSGCDISNGQGSDTRDRLANQSLGYLDSYSRIHEKNKTLVNSTLFHPEPNISNREELQEKEKVLNFHTQFLQSLIRMRKIATDRTPTAEILTVSSDYSVVTDSVSDLAKSLLVFCTKSRSLPPAPLLRETAQTLVHLLHDGKLPKLVLAQCIKRVDELVKELVKVILENTKVNRNQTELDVSSYENVYYLFWMLEQLLQHKTPAEEGVVAVNCVELEKLKQRLDSTILHLSDDFPLFTVYLWRLGALFNTISQQKNS